MCLLLLAYQHHPDYRLVVAANRDEFYDRPTAPAAFWEDDDLLAGRDLQGGGTWLGITRAGRFAAVTNYREPGRQRPDAPSRGALVADYLRGSEPPHAFLERLQQTADRYNGFNLLVGDTASLYHFSNREGVVNPVAPGLYGLSNALLDAPWPKVERGKAALQDVLRGGDAAPERLLEVLADATRAPDEALPDTGVGQAWERVLSPLFIESPTYGTRSSTVLLLGCRGEVTFVERTFPSEGAVPFTKRHAFTLQSLPEDVC